MVFRLTPPTGSSPLARGLPEADWPRRREDRIIPARAGFTTAFRLPAASARDHPRSRGVYHAPSQRLALERRIIPARAGFTRPASRSRRRRWDHPRSRGVYAHMTMVPIGTAGSSPLARGLPACGSDGGAQHRIIPARAGFTARNWRNELADEGDHPRSRGVYISMTLTGTTGRGSSPLARGLQSWHHPRH